MVDFETQNKEEQVKKDEPVKPKSKLKTKMGLAEKGDITIRGATSRIVGGTTPDTHDILHGLRC